MPMLALASRILVISLSAATLTAQWHVSPNGSDAGAGTPADPFRTINHAAAVAAPGETLHLQAGVFADEQGIVDLGDKDLVLQGAGVGATFLRPHTTLTAALPPALTGGGAAVPYRVGVLVDGAARVHLRDLTIDAQAQASAAGHLAGVYVRGGADVVVDRCRLRDCRAAAPGGGRTHAFVVHGDAPVDPSTLACRLVEVVGFGDGGVFARLRAELDLQECLLVGRGRETVAEQVAVAVVDDAQLQLRASRIAACGGAGGAAVRLLQPTTGCRIDANRVTRCAFGIDIEHQPPSIVPGTISHNRISSVDTALRLSGVSGWSVFGNALLPVSRFDPAPFSDDTAAGNAWHGNRYPVLADGAAAPLAVPGGGNVDAAPLAGSSELRELTRVPCGGAPVSVVTADFDGDGREDFATLDLQGVGASLTVALWRPTGHQVSVQAFGGPATRPVRLVVGEFDEDPGTDLVALLAPAPPATGAGAFWVFGNDGAGALAPLHQQPLAGFVDPCDVANVRLNGDGRDDLVIVDRGAPLLLAGGGATFVNSFGGVSWLSSPLPGTFSTPVTAVAAGDLDGDAIDDVAVVSGGVGSGALHAWAGDGIGGLLAGLGGPWSTPASPQGVTIADHDGDGDLDVLVAAFAGALPLQRGALQVFENQAGALSAAQVLPTDLGPTRVLAGDFDADAFPAPAGRDLLVLNEAAGDLNLFGSRHSVAGFVDGGLLMLADGPVDVALADLDLDPYLDVVVAEPSRGGVALLHGSPTARVATFGRGCPGTGGRTPRLRVDGAPGLAVQPNTTLQFELLDGFPNSVAGCAVSLDLAPTLTPCQYLLGAPLMLFAAPLDANGRGVFPLPLPALPDARGLRFYAQAGVFDFAATTSFLPDISLTAAIGLRVGD